MKKKYHLEVIRILAILMVMYNHSAAFMSFSNQSGVEYAISFLFSMVCKGAVPLFFMVSGALLLGKNESGKLSGSIPWNMAVCPGHSYILKYETSLSGRTAIRADKKDSRQCRRLRIWLLSSWWIYWNRRKAGCHCWHVNPGNRDAAGIYH